MPTFETPHPLTVTVDVPAGDIRFAAADRADTTVEIVPSSTMSKADARAAEQAVVELSGTNLLIRVPREAGLFGRTGAVRVTVALPGGSAVRAATGSGDLRARGPLGDCRVRTASGDVRFERTGAFEAETSSGDVTVEDVDGDATVTVNSGDVRIDRIGGAATVRGTSGDIRLGAVAGDLRVGGANGDITVEAAGADVTVKTASGDIRIGEVARGRTLVEAASGDLNLGVREGVAAWLDLTSLSGDVKNRLEAADGPREGDGTVEIRARILSGDITVHRSRSVLPTP